MTVMIDVDVPRFNQAVVALLVALAFVFELEWLVAATAALLAISRVLGQRAPLSVLYVRLLRPRLRPQGPTAYEPAAPPRFAQLLGTVVLTAATAAFLVGAEAVGWALSLLVVALAALAATTRVCVGCIIYERLHREAAAR